MSELLGIPIGILAPLSLGIYALAFIAGGIYYLEQRVARIHDQFPGRTALARLTGITALLIGLLATASIAGYFLWGPGPVAGAVVAVGAGVAFAVYHLYIDLLPRERIRDIALALVCLALMVLVITWIQTSLA